MKDTTSFSFLLECRQQVVAKLPKRLQRCKIGGGVRIPLGTRPIIMTHGLSLEGAR